jgi:hypothetical protein
MSALLEKSELDRLVGGCVVNTDGASTQAIAAPGAGQRIVITDVVVVNVSADTSGTVDIRDGVSGAARATYPAPKDGGPIHRLGAPIVLSANTAAAIDVYIYAHGAAGSVRVDV